MTPEDRWHLYVIAWLLGPWLVAVVVRAVWD